MRHLDKSAAQQPAWDADTLRDPHRRADKAKRVESMFDAIAPTYERVNAVVSMGRDAAWRRLAVSAAQVQPGDTVLDVACGTGDMIRVFASAEQPPAGIIGIDFAEQMLVCGHYDRQTRIHLCRADALRLPLKDRCVDVISCAFGVRNFQNLQAGLREMERVARPRARIVILEFSNPENPMLRWGYRLYVNRVLPAVSALISRDQSGAYRYLPRSVETFESKPGFAARLEDAGFTNVSVQSLNFGGVALFRGEKREE